MVRLDTNLKPNPKTAFFRIKKIERRLLSFFPALAPIPTPRFADTHLRERAMLPLSICEIKIWGNSNCESVTTENIYGTRVIYGL